MVYVPKHTTHTIQTTGDLDRKEVDELVASLKVFVLFCICSLVLSEAYVNISLMTVRIFSHLSCTVHTMLDTKHIKHTIQTLSCCTHLSWSDPSHQRVHKLQ